MQSKIYAYGNLSLAMAIGMVVTGGVMGEAFFLLMRKRISSDISNLALTGYLCFL